MRLRWIFALSVLLSGPDRAVAQDWCSKAKTPTEVAICANPELGARDLYLSTIYPILRRGIGLKDQVLATQRAWIKNRAACGSDSSCLQSSYDGIIDVYKRVALGANLSLPAPQYGQSNPLQSNQQAPVTNNGAPGKFVQIGDLNIEFGTATANGNSMDALVVANADYADIPDLQTPSSDAELVSSALRLRGITSVVKANTSRAQLDEALSTFRESPRKDVFVFYYAGHAADINGKSSLLFPAFKMGNNASNGEYEPISEVVGKISKLGYKKVLIVFDACRNLVELNEEVSASVPAMSAPANHGSAPKAYRNLGDRDVNLNALRGLDYAISFSASEGQFAIDSLNGKNSPFAEAFSQNIREKPTFFDAIIETRRMVKRSTENKQHPTLEMSWDEDVSLSSTAIKSASVSFHEPIKVAFGAPSEAVKYVRTDYQNNPVYSLTEKYDGEEICKNYNGLTGSDDFDFYQQSECLAKKYKISAENGSTSSVFSPLRFQQDGVTQVCGSADFITDIDNDGKMEKLSFSSNRYGGSVVFEREGHKADFYSTLGCSFSRVRLYDIDGKGIRDVIIEYSVGDEEAMIVLSGEKLSSNRDGTFMGGNEDELAKYVKKSEWNGVIGGLSEVAIFYDAPMKYVSEIFGNQINYAAFHGTYEGGEPNVMPDKKVTFEKDGSIRIKTYDRQVRIMNFGGKGLQVERE